MRLRPMHAAFAHRRWLSRDGGLGAVLRSGVARLVGAPPRLRPLTTEHVATVVFEANFIGIVAARSLHFQFYAWYAFTLPYLAWRAALPTPVRLALLAVIEACWNVFPPTPAASAALLACHAVLLVALAAAPLALPHEHADAAPGAGAKATAAAATGVQAAGAQAPEQPEYRPPRTRSRAKQA